MMKIDRFDDNDHDDDYPFSNSYYRYDLKFMKIKTMNCWKIKFFQQRKKIEPRIKFKL